MSERAYCLHIRDGIFGFFAYAWEDSKGGGFLDHLAPSDVVRIDAYPGKWMLPDGIKAGAFCRILYVRNESMGTFRAEPISERLGATA